MRLLASIVLAILSVPNTEARFKLVTGRQRNPDVPIVIDIAIAFATQLAQLKTKRSVGAAVEIVETLGIRELIDPQTERILAAWEKAKESPAKTGPAAEGARGRRRGSGS